MNTNHLDIPTAANDNKPKYVSTNLKHSHTLLTWLLLDEEDCEDWPTFEDFLNTELLIYLEFYYYLNTKF